MSIRKILIVGSTRGEYGGMESFMLTIAHAVEQWPEFEVRTCMKLLRGATVHENLRAAGERMGSRVDFVQSASPDLFRAIWWADVLHVHNVPLDVMGAAKLFGKRVYCTIHNWRRPAANLHGLSWSLAFRLADRRWYNSKFVMETWEPGEPRPYSEAFPSDTQLPEGGVPPDERAGFLFLGRWIPNKGIEELVRAYASCTFDKGAWPLTIVGDGPLRDEVRELVGSLDMREQIRLPGFVSVEEKARLLRSAKWLAAPANTREDLGVTPIEARNVGVPSIVTRDGGLPESGGPAALLADPGDVESLARCLTEAAGMSEGDYAARARLAKDSLVGYLRPRSFYREAFNADR